MLQSKQGQDFGCNGYAPLDLPEDFIEALDPDPGVGVFLGGLLREDAVAERQEEASAVHGQDHLLEAVGVAVRGGGGWLRGVLGYVVGGLGGRFDQANVDDVAVARGNVPLTAEVDRVHPRRVAQDVEVRVPVGGLHAPFDLQRRKATFDAATPPASPPEPPERSEKTIQSMGERLRITGKGECDKAGWEVSKPVAYSGRGEGGAVYGAGDAPSRVTIVGPDTVLIGVLLGAVHPGIAPATAKSSDAISSRAKSDQSCVHKRALSVPARVSKSQAKIIMVLYPRQGGLHRGVDGCFWRVKYSQTRPAVVRHTSHGLRQRTPLPANRRPR